jgi:hypothetical protein
VEGFTSKEFRATVGSFAAGEHQLFIGQVLEIGLDPEGQPLVPHSGRYKPISG